MNFLDEGRCLCCNSGKEGSIEHLVYECEAFRNERIHIPGTIDDNVSLVDRVRSLLGIGAEEDVWIGIAVADLQGELRQYLEQSGEKG